MSQQFCPRLSDAIGSKILSLDKLFRTPRYSKFQNFAARAFHSHISYLWREVAKNLNYFTTDVTIDDVIQSRYFFNK